MSDNYPQRHGVAIGCLLSMALVVVLPGCESQPQPVAVAKTVEKYAAAASLQGLVADDGGPVKAGVVKALSEHGDELAHVELSGSPRYHLEIPAGTLLPLLLAYYPPGRSGDDNRMLTAVIHASVSKYDINPSSTRIAKQAKALGGYTHKNLVRAAEETGIVPADNKTTAGFRGDPTTQYGGWH